MRTPWQRRTVTFPGLAPFPALVDPFQDNFGNHLVVTEKNGPDALMKAHADQLSGARAQDYDVFVTLEELYVDQISRDELIRELELLIAKTRRDHPGIAAMLLTLNACVYARCELKLAAHIHPFSQKHMVSMLATRNAMRNAEN